MRQLKYHEQKLLKKTNLLHWEKENNLREAAVIRRYHIQRPEDYQQYNRLVGQIAKLANQLSLLDPTDATRQALANSLMDKLFQRRNDNHDK